MLKQPGFFPINIAYYLLSQSEKRIINFSLSTFSQKLEAAGKIGHHQFYLLL